MRERAQIETLERIHRAERRSFVRYLVEVGSPTLMDDADRRVQGLLDAWCRDSRANAERLERLLRGEGHPPGEGSWSLQFTQYNYLRGSYLLQPLRARMGSQVAAIEGEARGIAGWPGAESAVRELLESHRRHLATVEELEREFAPAAAEPAGERRQTSANWW